MSRIGKQPIPIPENTEVTKDNETVTVRGTLGELSRQFRKDIDVVIEGGEVRLKPVKDTLLSKALWGTYASHLKNMIQGVNQAFEKKLIIEGVGFRAEVLEDTLVLSVGFSHKVKVPIPENIEVTVQKNVIIVKGISKELVGQFAARVRAVKKPEPYKGKGIRYEDEVVRRKQGKKAT